MSRNFLLAAAAVFLVAMPLAAGQCQSLWSNVPMPGAGGTTGGSDCNTAVQQHQDSLAQQLIAGQTNIANAAFTPMPQNFSKMSCVSNLLNLLNGDMIFSPPSLSSILGALENEACSIMQGYVNQGESMLSSAVSQSLGSTGGLAPVLPGYLPGVSMGSILSASGAGVSVGAGGNTLIRTNMTSQLNGGTVFQAYPYNPSTFGGGLFSVH
jgi:hypothetical protein